MARSSLITNARIDHAWVFSLVDRPFPTRRIAQLFPRLTGLLRLQHLHGVVQPHALTVSAGTNAPHDKGICILATILWKRQSQLLDSTPRRLF